MPKTVKYHDFGQGETEDDTSQLIREGDLHESLPNVFELVDEKDGGFCSNPQQIIGIFTRKRVFGGQTFTQFYMAAKKFANDRPIKRLEILFYGAGNSTLPIHYRQRLICPSTKLILMDAFQKEGKLIGSGSARFIDEEPFDYLPPRFDADIPKPLDCPTLKEAKINTPYFDPWIEKFGNSLNTTTLGPKNELFELRPIDYDSFAGLDSKSQKMQCWVRLAPHLHHIDLKEPMFVPMTICDYLACHPVISALDQLKIHFKSGASLTHKVFIHRSTGFDPKGFFLVENTLESLSRSSVGLFHGRVFDESGQCVLSFIQGNFNKIEMEDSNTKAKI